MYTFRSNIPAKLHKLFTDKVLNSLSKSLINYSSQDFIDKFIKICSIS